MTTVQVIFSIFALVIAFYAIIKASLKRQDYLDLMEWRRTLKPGDVIYTTGRPAKYEIMYIQKPYTRHSVVRARIYQTTLPCINTTLGHVFPSDVVNDS